MYFKGGMYPFGCIYASLCLTQTYNGTTKAILGATQCVNRDSGNTTSFRCNHSVSSWERNGSLCRCSRRCWREGRGEGERRKTSGAKLRTMKGGGARRQCAVPERERNEKQLERRWWNKCKEGSPTVVDFAAIRTEAAQLLTIMISCWYCWNL